MTAPSPQAGSSTPQQGLSIFDNASTGGFTITVRGYDRDQVERYVRRIEDRLTEATARADERAALVTRADAKIQQLAHHVQELKEQLDDALGKLAVAEQPNFAALGEHVAELLRRAEEQAQAVVNEATATAAEHLKSTRQEVAQMRHDAREETQLLRSNAQRDTAALLEATQVFCQQVRNDAERRQNEYISRAQADSEQLLVVTRAECERMVHDATTTVNEERARLRDLIQRQEAHAARIIEEAETEAQLVRHAASEAAARLSEEARSSADAQRAAAEVMVREARAHAEDDLQTMRETVAALRQHWGLPDHLEAPRTADKRDRGAPRRGADQGPAAVIRALETGDVRPDANGQRRRANRGGDARTKAESTPEFMQ